MNLHAYFVIVLSDVIRDPAASAPNMARNCDSRSVTVPSAASWSHRAMTSCDLYQNTNQSLLLNHSRSVPSLITKDNLLFNQSHVDQTGKVLPIHYMPFCYSMAQSPQVVPNYINNPHYGGPWPGSGHRLATVLESSQEELDGPTARMISASTRAEFAPHDADFEVIQLSPSTPPPSYC